MVYEKLLILQNDLKVEKTRTNLEYGYMYRNAEDIITAAKPVLKKTKCVLTTPSEILAIGNRSYVSVTAILTDTETGEQVSASAMAGIPNSNPKFICLDSGAAISYAKKYALSNLFALDDGVDADNMGDNNVPTGDQIDPKNLSEKEKTDISSQMSELTLEEALAVEGDMGACKGRTLLEIKEKQPKNLFWLLKQGSAASEAIRVVINADENLRAMCERQTEKKQNK